MTKKTHLIFAVIIIVLSLVFLPQHNTYSASDPSSSNLMQNLENKGLVAKQGKWLYYTTYTSLCKIEIDKISNESHNDAVFVSSNSAESLNISDGWIYYSGHTLSNSGYTDTVIKTRLDGKETVKLNEEASENVKLVDDWIYYLQLPDRQLYRMKTDGSNKMRLSNDKTYYYYVCGDYVFYQNQSDHFKMYRIKTDGSNRTKISDESTGPFSIIDDKIYYTHGGKLYKMNLNGKEKAEVIDDNVSCFNIYNGWIYYSNKSDSYKLYKVKIDGTSRTKLLDTPVHNINIIDDWIFFNRVNINKDGSLTWSTKHINAVRQDVNRVYELQAAHYSSSVSSKSLPRGKDTTSKLGFLAGLAHLIGVLLRRVFIFLIVFIIAAFIIKRARNYNKLRNFPEELKDDLTNNKVKKFIRLIQKTKFTIDYEMKNKLIGAFILINESENIHSKLKYELRDLLLTKGVPLTKVNIKKSKQEEQMAKKHGGKKGEKDVQYALEWLEDYKTLHNVKIPHRIATQEFDHIVIGKNGVFHIETKNHSGVIRIKENGDWLRIKNGKTESVENPLFQVQRHERVLKDYFSDLFPDKNIPIKSIVVIANSKTILEGEENCALTVLKRERLNSFIEDYKSDKLLDDKTITEIYEELSKLADKN